VQWNERGVVTGTLNLSSPSAAPSPRRRYLRGDSPPILASTAAAVKRTAIVEGRHHPVPCSSPWRLRRDVASPRFAHAAHSVAQVEAPDSRGTADPEPVAAQVPSSRRLCAWRELKGEDLRYRYRVTTLIRSNGGPHLLRYSSPCPLTPEGRRKLVELVIDGHWVQARSPNDCGSLVRRSPNGCAAQPRRVSLGLPTVRRNRGRHRLGHHFGRNGESSLCGSLRNGGDPGIGYHPHPPQSTVPEFWPLPGASAGSHRCEHRPGRPQPKRSATNTPHQGT
jgi:hypothetical protein